MRVVALIVVSASLSCSRPPLTVPPPQKPSPPAPTAAAPKSEAPLDLGDVRIDALPAPVSLLGASPDRAEPPDDPAACDSLFLSDAPTILRARLRGPGLVAWNAYCFSAPTGLGAIGISGRPTEAQQAAIAAWTKRQVAARERLMTVLAHARDAASRVALGYVLAERAYEDARGASWRCEMCENGPPNHFDRAAFVAQLSASHDFAGALAQFDAVRAGHDDLAWLARLFARELRSDAEQDGSPTLEEVTSAPPPSDARSALVFLAGDALDSGNLALGRSLLAEAPDDAAGVASWRAYLAGRWRDALDAALSALAQVSYAGDAPEDMFAVGTQAAERLGAIPASAPAAPATWLAKGCASRAFASFLPQAGLAWLARAGAKDDGRAAKRATTALADPAQRLAIARVRIAALGTRCAVEASWTGSFRLRASVHAAAAPRVTVDGPPALASCITAQAPAIVGDLEGDLRARLVFGP